MATGKQLLQTRSIFSLGITHAFMKTEGTLPCSYFTFWRSRHFQRPSPTEPVSFALLPTRPLSHIKPGHPYAFVANAVCFAGRMVRSTFNTAPAGVASIRGAFRSSSRFHRRCLATISMMLEQIQGRETPGLPGTSVVPMVSSSYGRTMIRYQSCVPGSESTQSTRTGEGVPKKQKTPESASSFGNIRSASDSTSYHGL